MRVDRVRLTAKRRTGRSRNSAIDRSRGQFGRANEREIARVEHQQEPAGRRYRRELPGPAFRPDR